MTAIPCLPSPPRQAHPLDFVDLLVLPLLTLGLLMIYWVVLLIPYGYLDDYFWLEISVRHPATVFADQAVQGRPLNGYILQWIFSHAGGIAGLWKIRALILVQMSAIGWLFYTALRRVGVEMRHAILLAMLACVVPAMQVYAAWATSIAVPLSGILAAAAALVSTWAQDNPRKRWPAFPAAAILLLASATIYQPTAMVFWPVAALHIFQSNRRVIPRFFIHLAVAIVGLGLAFAVFKYGLAHHPERPSIQRSGVTHEPLKKIKWYFQHPIVDSLNLFNMLRPIPQSAIVIAVFLIAGLLHSLPGTIAQRLLSLAIAAMIFPLAYLPNLAAEESWASFRTQIGMEWLVLVLAFLALRGLLRSRALHITLMVVTVLAASQVTFQAGLMIALPQFHEMAALKKQLDRPEVATANRIILIQPGATSSFEPLPFSRYDEFGRTSLEADWVPQSEVDQIRRAEDPNLPRIEVTLRKDIPGPLPDPLPPGTAIIDMRPVGREH